MLFIVQERKESENHWLWLILVSSVLLFASIFFFQTREKIINDPIIGGGIARKPVSTADGLDLYDEICIRQAFFINEPEFSGITIGLRNLRKAIGNGKILISLENEAGNELGKRSYAVSEIRDDGLLKTSWSRSLKKGVKYFLVIRTENVDRTHALSLYYEPAINSLENAELTVEANFDHVRHQQVGHIGFNIERMPTFGVLFSIFRASRAIYLLVIYLILILLIFVTRPLRRFLVNILREKMILSENGKVVNWREKIFVFSIALFLAIIVTLPFYLNLVKMDSMGDVQRNLLFRALGRESILKDGVIAQWDPYTCGGVPLLANIESAHTDPFFLLSLAFGENVGLRLSVTLTFALGFLGTYLLARRFLETNEISSILAGVIYSFSGFQMLAFSTGVFAWIPVGLIPLFVYFYLRSLEKNIYLIPSAGMLAWIFLGGGPHMPVFAVILTALLAIGVALGFRTLRPLLMLYFVLIMAGLFSAVKLLPTTELVVIFDAFNRLPSFIAPLAWLPKMFVDRHQEASFAWNYALTGENYRWSEFGSYVGLVPMLLFFLGLPFVVRKKMSLVWLIVGLVILVMVFGFFPWTLIQQIPVLKEIVRNPQRLRSIFLLPFGLLCAYGLNVISEKLIRKTVIRNIVVGLLVLFVIGDLLVVGAPGFYNLFNLTWPKLSRQEKFIRLNGGYTDEDTGFYKAGYLNYLAQEGTTDLCVPNMAVGRTMMASGKGTTSTARPYLGEAYILDSDTRAEVVAVSPTKIIVQMEKLERDGWLIINQNYYPGWITTPKRAVERKNGLVAARILKGDQQIVFQYVTPSFYLGFFVSLISVVLASGMVIKNWVNKRYF